MIDAVIQWSIGRRLIVIAGALALLLWGGWQTTQTPVDVFPDLTAPTVTVIADAHGMAPETMEQRVTFPIETALNGAAGVRRVRSSTSVGISVIRVEFDWDADVYVARQVVSEKLQLVRASLPEGMEPPVLAPVSSIMGEVMFVAVTSTRHTPMDIRTQVESQLRRRLLAVPGVSQVMAIGGELKQFQVVLNPDALRYYDISEEAVTQALRESNEDASAGFYLEGGQEYLIHGQGRIYDLEDIRQTLVTTRGGLPVTVGEVATVDIGPALKRGEGSFNAGPSVILGIQKQPGVNTLALTERLDAVLTDMRPTLPQGMEIHSHIFRQSDFIQVSIDNVAIALRDGAALVVVIVLFFLFSGRATLITAITIPLSLVTAVVVIRWLGGSLNTMTLGGMAIAVGALVDDAIIDVENVARRLRENNTLPPDARRPTALVVFEASREVRGSIVFATLIIVLVFVPLFFLHGVEGRLLAPLGLAYVVSLGASLVVSLTVTPALASLWLPGSRAVRTATEPLPVRGMRALYRWILRRLIGHWVLLSVVSLLVLAVAIWSLLGMGRSFLPPFNEGSLTISAVTLPGTSLAQADALGRLVEHTLLKHPEVISTARRTGRAEQDEHAQGTNAAEIDVNLKPTARGQAAFLEALRADFARIPGMNITIGQPISHRIDHMLSGTRANIAVKVFGPDLATLRAQAERIKAVMENVPGVVDLSIEQQADIPFLTIRYLREEMAVYGLRVLDVSHAIERGFAGQVVSQVLDEGMAFDLIVRHDPSLIQDLDLIRALPLRTPSGEWIRLDQVADIQRDIGPNTISREDAGRLMVVMCNVSGRDLRGVVEDIRAQIQAQITLPSGYHVGYGGQFEAAERASQVLLWLGIGVVFGILILLQVAFGSLRDALLIMLNLPLALIGGVGGVWLFGGVVSIASLIGFITLFGIATRNGIMLVSHIRHLREAEGEDSAEQATLQGAEERLAPILMTALASGLGLLPLALAAGEPGAEIQAPMAAVILYGLISSTLLNMFVVPALYLRFGSRGQTWTRPGQQQRQAGL